MSKLTEEQIEAAAKEGYSAADNQYNKSGIAHRYSTNHISWNELAEVTKDMWRVAVRYAAPFLQVPWDEPTFEELKKACFDFTYCENRDSTCMGIPLGPMRDAFSKFVSRRNDDLIQKPVDPRREKLLRAVNAIRTHESAYTSSEMVTAILAALDAKE